MRSRSTISAGCASEPCVEMSSSNSVYGDAQSSRIGARRVLGADVARAPRGGRFQRTTHVEALFQRPATKRLVQPSSHLTISCMCVCMYSMCVCAQSVSQ